MSILPDIPQNQGEKLTRFPDDASESPKLVPRNCVTSISISTASIKTVNGRKQYVIYNIHVEMRTKDGDVRWQLYRRYNDFLEMHNRLPQDQNGLPTIPGKVIVGNFTKSFLEQRRDLLENYLNQLLKCREVTQSEAFKEFTGQEAMSEEFLMSFPHSYRSGRPKLQSHSSKNNCIQCLIC